MDKGAEYNSTFKDYLKENGITLYSTQNVEKSSIIERFNRILKNKMFRQFTVHNNTIYTDILPKIVDKCNDSSHNTVQMTPKEASLKKNESIVYLNSYHSKPIKKLKAPNFKIGDKVRISTEEFLVKVIQATGVDRLGRAQTDTIITQLTLLILSMLLCTPAHMHAHMHNTADMQTGMATSSLSKRNY